MIQKLVCNKKQKSVFAVFILVFFAKFILAQNVSLVFPKDNYFINDTTINFIWDKDTAAVSYELLLAKDSIFTDITTNPTGITGNSFQFDSLILGQTYYWKVRYFDGSSNSLWSDTFQFTVFVPIIIPNLKLWLKGDSVTTTNGKVTLWKDNSGNGNNASQADTTKSPTLQLSESLLNDYPVLEFEGANVIDDQMDFSTITNIRSCFFVVKQFSSNPDFAPIIGHSATFDFIGGAGSSLFGPFTSSSIKNGLFFENGISISPLSVFKPDDYSILSLLTTGDVESNNIAADRSFRTWDGAYAEIIVYSDSLADSNRTNIESYLRYKYAPPINLGANVTVLCNAPYTVDAGNGFVNYIWSTGATTSSITVTQNDTVSVIVTDVFGFTSSDTINISGFTPPPSINVMSDTTICLWDTIIWNLGLGSNYAYLWQDSSTDTLIKISTADSYYVQFTDTAGCIFNSDTVVVVVDSFPAIAGLGPDDSLCSGNSIGLLTGAGSAVTYAWNTAEDSSLHVIDTSGLYIVTVTNSLGCQSIDSINIIIKGIAPAFNTTFTDSICRNDINVFTGITIDSIVSWQWIFGTGDTLTSINSNTTYSYDTSGVFQVEVLATDTNGCTGVTQDSITVYGLPTVQYSVSTDNVGVPIVFTDASIPSAGDSITSWQWTISSSYNNSQSTFVRTFDSVSNYLVQLVINTFQGCSDTLIDTLSILPPAPPVLISPSDGDVVYDSPVDLEWIYSLGNDTFILEISFDSLFILAPEFMDTVYGKIYQYTIGLPDTSYYWRVKGQTAWGYSQWSSVYRFQYKDITTIGGMQLWLRSDSGVTLNVNDVAQWQDYSGNNLLVEQSITSEQPAFVDSINLLNNYGVLRFDGSGKNLDLSTLSLSGLSIFSVAKKQAMGNNLTVLGGSGTVSFVNFSDDITYLILNASGSIPSINGGDMTQYSIISGLHDNVNYQLFVNGISKGSAGYNESGSFNTIGDRQNGTASTTGDIAEIIVFNSALDSSNRESIENYLHAKYAPPVNLGPDVLVCDTTPYIVDAGDRFVSYIWSTAPTDTTTDSTIIVNTPGTYWVKVQDVFGFWSSDTIEVSAIRPDVVINNISNTTLCVGNSILWNIYIDSTYAYYWQDNLNDSSYFIDKPGIYYARIIDTSGCIFYSDTITITIDSFNITAGFDNIADTSLCQGNSLSIVSGASQAVSYQWSTTDTIPVITISSAGLYEVTVTDSIGCTAIDSINVNIKGVAPIALFISNNSCFGDSVGFTDNSYPNDTISNVVDWQWNFGDNSTDSVQNPSHLYTYTGTYTVTLTVTTDSTCSNSTSNNVTVFGLPQANFEITTSPLCSNVILDFTDNSVVADTGLASWNWDFGDSGLANVQKPTHIYNSGGVFTIQLIVSDSNGCLDTTIKNYTINESPAADFYAQSACKNAPIIFSDNSYPANTGWTWSWDFENDGTQDASTSNPTHIYTAPGVYITQMTVTDLSGCFDTTTKTVEVYYNPVAGFTGQDVCIDVPFTFEDTTSIQGSSIASWAWKAINTLPLQTANDSTATFTFSETTAQFYAELIVVSAQGCKDSITKEITVNENPTADFAITSEILGAPINVEFLNLSSGEATWQWNFGDSSALDTNENPSHNYAQNGQYEIWLTAYNQNGCIDSVAQSINISDPIYDLAVMNCSVNENNNFMSIYAQVYNFGNRDVTVFEITVESSNGNSVKETPMDTIKAGENTLYEFMAKFELNNGELPDVVCVKVANPNYQTDADPTNDECCISNANEFKITEFYPNPVSDQLNLEFVIPQDGPVQLQIYNDIGQIMRNIEITATEGRNFLLINTVDFSSATYVVRLSYGKNSVVKSFFKQKSD
ncbi:MAG: hypothetical protein COA57_01065 [Flavobacteriales bacterium]|nr:MAG: hypothetical protein COA57_01065 [Flavobacteriales bacterium]